MALLIDFMFSSLSNESPAGLSFETPRWSARGIGVFAEDKRRQKQNYKKLFTAAKEYPLPGDTPCSLSIEKGRYKEA
jgi:hypothetical protein